MAIFANRKPELRSRGPYKELLDGKCVKRFYLEVIPLSEDPALGFEILRLVLVPDEEAKSLVDKLVKKSVAICPIASGVRRC